MNNENNYPTNIRWVIYVPVMTYSHHITNNGGDDDDDDGDDHDDG